MPNGGAADVNRDICMKLHGTGPFVLQFGRRIWDWQTDSQLLYGTDDWRRALLALKEIYTLTKYFLFGSQLSLKRPLWLA